MHADQDQEAAVDESGSEQAEAEVVSVIPHTAASQAAAQQLLSSILDSWTMSKTARAAHPALLPDKQQQIIDWMLEHRPVTISTYAQVWTSSCPDAVKCQVE